MTEKARFLTDVLQQLAHSKDSPKALVMSKHLDAYYHMSTGQHERCLEAMSEGLDLAQKTGIHVFDGLLFSSGVWSALNVGDLATAEELLEKMGSPSGTSGRLDKHLYHTLRTNTALARGNLTQAALHADLVLEASEGLGSPQATFSGLLTNAHVMHQSGRDQEAKEHLARAMEIADRIGFETFKYNGLLAEALFAHDQRKDELSTTALRRGLAIARKGGYFYMSPPYATARLCIKALETGIETDHVRELIRRLNVHPEESPIDLGNDIDLANDVPTKTIGQGVFVIGTTGINAQIQRNTIMNCSRNSIETIDNFLGKDGSGMVFINDNKMVTAAEGVPVPAPTTPTGMVVGWFLDKSGGLDPQRNIKHIVTNNAVRTRGKTSPGGIAVLTDGAVVVNNAILSEGAEAFSLAVLSSEGYIAHNKMEGVSTGPAILVRPSQPLKGSKNVFVDNDLKEFKTSAAHVLFEKDTHSNLFIGHNCKVSDLGSNNSIQMTKW